MGKENTNDSQNEVERCVKNCAVRLRLMRFTEKSSVEKCSNPGMAAVTPANRR